jgi:hypothetical protein
LKQTVPKLDDWSDVQEFLQQPGSVVITEKKLLKQFDSAEYNILFERKDLFGNPTIMVISAPS